MSSQADLEPVRKRQRKAKACQPCRGRKVRCDLASPCGPCQRSRIPDLMCTYRDFPQDTVRSEAARQTPENAHHPAQTPHTVSPATNGAVPPLPSQDVNKIQELEERVRRLEEEAAMHHRSVTDATHNNEMKIDGITPRLRITSEKVKLFGPSHWVHTADKVYKFGSFDAAVEPVLGFDKKEWSRICTELRKLRRGVKLLQQPANVGVPLQASQLVDTLPSHRISHALVQNYFRTFGSIYRIIDVRQFSDKLEQFWQERSEASQKPTFILKLVLILAIGIPFLSNSEAGVDANTASELRRQAKQWIYATQWWLTGPTEKSTQNLDALQIFSLALIARQVHGLGNSPALSPSSLASLAVQMGLNRNPRPFLPGIFRYQVECMSRLWATVSELLLASYLESGLPPPVLFEDSDVDKPSNIDDFDLKDGPDTASPPTFEARTTDISVHLLLLKSQKLRIQALRVINSAQTRVSYEKVMDLASQLRSACAEVTKFFNERKSDFPTNPNFSRRYIDTYLRRHIFLLHRPFMLKAQKDPRFYLSHKMCVESAMIMASYTDELNLPSEITDDFAKMMVQASGHLRGGLTLDVAMTLALELNASLQGEDEQNGDDPARALSRSLRRPFLQRLTHIRDQLFHVIELGNPSLKRFLMISSFLAQLEALEAGGNAKASFFDAVRQDAQACVVSLQKYLDTHTPKLSDISSTAAASDDTEFDFGNVDFGNFLDPMVFFDPMTWGENNHINIETQAH